MIMNISIFTVSGLHWPWFLNFARYLTLYLKTVTILFPSGKNHLLTENSSPDKAKHSYPEHDTDIKV